MALSRMGKQSESVRFLDDVDIKIASESHSELNEQVSNLTILCEPLLERLLESLNDHAHPLRGHVEATGCNG